MSSQDDIKKLLKYHERRLQKLKEKSAKYGISADPSIGLEIDDIKEKIEDLQAELSIHNSANYGVPSDSKILIEIKNIEKKIETLQKKSQGVENVEEIKPATQSCYVNLGKVSAVVIFLSLLIIGAYSLIYSLQTNYQATQTAIALAAITPTSTVPAPLPTNTPTDVPTATNTSTPLPSPTDTPISSTTPTSLFASTDTPPVPTLIYEKSLASGYDLDVQDGEGNIQWFSVESGDMRMGYPGGQSWGVVYITVGPPTSYPRAGQDFSSHSKLAVEMRGEVGNEIVGVGIKDNMDLDNGSETIISVSGLTSEWQTFEFPLSEFTTADLTNVYVVAEFIFGNEPATVYVRKIQYLP